APRLEEIGPPKAVFVLGRLALGGEPVGPLPAIFLAEHGAELLLAVVARRGLGRPRPGPFLERVMQDEDVLVGLLVLDLGVALVGISAEAARVDVPGIDLGIALDDPLRQPLAG